MIKISPKKGKTITDEMAMRLADRMGKTTILKDGTIYRGKITANADQV